MAKASGRTQWRSQHSYSSRPQADHSVGGTDSKGGKILSCPSGILAKTGLSEPMSMTMVKAKTMVQNGVSVIPIKVSLSFHHPAPATGPTGLLPISVRERVGFTSSGAA